VPNAPAPPVPPLVTKTERTAPSFAPVTAPSAAIPPSPPGRAIFRFGYGDTVPMDYLDRKYRVEDYAEAGLVAPPAGMAWVRVGTDAVLVNLNTHTVVSAKYGVFRDAATPPLRP
jgi:hypothetical protein